jgi:predicted DsbA family dithiol-disulfide isomerase
MFADAGLPFAPARSKVPNSRHSLMLGELAREQGVYDALHPRLFDAYWARGLDLGDDEVLIAEGAAVGLDRDQVEAALGDGRYLEQVEYATQALMEIGGSGVPAWLIDRRVLVPGAQPHEVFERVLERLGHAPVEE